jgi:hypothetical protein
MKNTVLILLASFCLITLTACEQAPPPPPPKPKPQAPLTPEEAEMRREARELGTRLYATANQPEVVAAKDEQQQVMLKPIYNDIESFIFKRMSSYSNRITSITVTYSRPSIQCIIYVSAGDEEELKGLKKAADSIVGRVIESLPIVKYLMVKKEQA